MQPCKSAAPRAGALASAATSSKAVKLLSRNVMARAASTSTVIKAPGTAVKELNADEIIASIKYGMLAKSAYFDTDREVEEAFATHAELKGAPFKRVIHTGTLWQTPLAGIKASTDTEVLCTRIGDEMVIAFRGTETSGNGAFRDILTDLFALQAHIGNMEGVPADRHPKDVKVHKGFLRSFNDVVQMTPDGKHDALRDVRDELFGKGVTPPKVTMCGHSLGAALATLGAFWLKSMLMGTPKAADTKVACYAFASPRVGNESFAKLFDSTVDTCYRFTHKNDVVPAVPASSAWEHVSESVLLIEPKKNTYGTSVSTSLPGGTKYVAVRARRPRPGPYASVGDHDMGLHLEALQDALKAKK